MNDVVRQREWGYASGGNARACELYFQSLPSPVLINRQETAGTTTSGAVSSDRYHHRHLPLPRCSISSSDDMWAASPSLLLSTPVTTTVGGAFSSYPSAQWNSNHDISALGYNGAGFGVVGHGCGNLPQQTRQRQEPPSVVTFFVNIANDDDVSVLHDDPDHDDEGILPQTTYDVLQDLFQYMDESDASADDHASSYSNEQDLNRPHHEYGNVVSGFDNLNYNHNRNIWSYDHNRNDNNKYNNDISNVDARNDWMGVGS